jgi:hypothetical protein
MYTVVLEREYNEVSSVRMYAFENSLYKLHEVNIYTEGHVCFSSVCLFRFRNCLMDFDVLYWDLTPRLAFLYKYIFI